MPNLEQLIPYSKDHSISEAAITIFLEQPLLKPERFEELIHSEFKELFQQFQPTFTQSIKLHFGKTQSNDIDKTEQEVCGFRFNSFIDGKLELVLQSQNDTIGGRYSISVHTLKYNRWVNFLEKTKKCLSVISKYQTGMYAKAYGLNYIDQFDWIGEAYPPMSSIFISPNNYLPTSVFESKDTWRLSFLQNTIEHNNSGDAMNCTNMLDIFNEKLANKYTIGITNGTTKALKEISKIEDLIVSPIFDEVLNIAHNNNKKELKSIFSQDVLNLIHLT